jgi:integrase
MKYRFAGREKLLALGVYPHVSLIQARRSRDRAKLLLAEGTDPSAERKAKISNAASPATADTFGTIALEWLGRQRGRLAGSTYKKAEWLLAFAGPLDKQPIATITAPDVLAVLRKIEATGHNETAHRVKQRIGQVMRYAIATGRTDRDVTADLRGALTPVTSTPRAALTDPAAIAALLRAIEGYEGYPATIAALKLAPLLFVRPYNLRTMEWSEVDLDAAEWRIPAAKMKMRDAHVVPLPVQAVALLRDLAPLTGGRRYVFPAQGNPRHCMSENTINDALQRLGYTGSVMVGHGFRAMASTRLNELGWSPDVIERQLAHAERNKVRAAYNRAQYMDERKKMMQAWADYLDGLRKGRRTRSPRKRRTNKSTADKGQRRRKHLA